MEEKNNVQGSKDPYSLQIVNPTAILRYSPLPPAKRLPELNNKKIGLYWNHKARGNIALERVKELLTERYKGMTFEWFETPISMEASKEWFENVKKRGVDGIVASTGD
jgi:hypothetical protein